MNLLPWYWRLFGALGLLLAALYGGWYERGEWDAGKAAEAQVQSVVASQPVVVKYVDRIVEVERSRPRVLPNLERLCRNWVVPGAGHPDAAAAPDPHAGDTVSADPGTILGLADDTASCAENAAQLARLQEVLRPQLPKSKHWWEP